MSAAALSPEPILDRSPVAEGLRIARKGTFAVADQALFSGANFFTNVLLARWLAPADYGAYSLAQAVFLLFAAVHAALLVEPMMVFGAGKYANRFPGYLRRLLSAHFVVMIPASLILWVVAIALGRIYSMAARQALLGLVIGATGILLFWLVRRIFYVLLQPAKAVVGGAVYFALMVGSVVGLRYAGYLSTFSGFLGMALVSLVTSGLMLTRFLPTATQDTNEPSFREAVADHWRYGRWAMATAVIAWFPGHVYYALLPAWIGLEGSAALRALMNFAMPVLQGISALSMLMLPMLVRDRDAAGIAKMTRTMLLFLTIFVAGAALYGIALWVPRDHVFEIFYGGKYAQYAGWPLLLAGLLPAGTCITSTLANGLRALERPDQIFWCSAGSLASSVAIGIPLAARYGVTGALMGLHASSVVNISLLCWFYIWDTKLGRQS